MARAVSQAIRVLAPQGAMRWPLQGAVLPPPASVSMPDFGEVSPGGVPGHEALRNHQEAFLQPSFASPFVVVGPDTPVAPMPFALDESHGPTTQALAARIKAAEAVTSPVEAARLAAQTEAAAGRHLQHSPHIPGLPPSASSGLRRGAQGPAGQNNPPHYKR